jgi:tryptophan synthase beta chain
MPEAMKVARKGKKSESIVVTLSGRGDKDIEEVQNYLNKHDKN